MKIKKAPRKEPDENLIPLINVVFLMLIFFIVAGTLKSVPENKVKPADIKDDVKASSKKVQMLVDADGAITLGENSLEKAELADYLGKNFSEVDKEKPFYILADRELNGSILIEILEIVNNSGIKKTHVVALRKGR